MSRAIPRHGRIDELGDIRALDTDRMFGDKYRTGTQPQCVYATNGFERPKEYYRQYVSDYAYQDQGRVIDLGGAYGRWAVFLAETNDEVVVVDNHPYLIDMGPRLAAHFGFDNVRYVLGSVEEVPAGDEEFDAAWLHGLIFLTNRDRTLSEIARILRPGGRAFMGAFNSLGKMIQKMCSGYAKGGMSHRHCVVGRTALRQGPLAPGPPNYGTADTLDRIFEPFGLEVETEFPIQDHRGPDRLDEEMAAELKDLGRLVDRFEQDEAFRRRMVDNHKDIMRSVEFDLWFSVRKA